MGFLSKLFDPGRGDRRAASEAAKRGRFAGTQMFGPLGISGGFENRDGRVFGSGSIGEFEPIARQLVASAGGGPAMDMSFMDPIFSGAMNDLGDPRLQSAQNRGQMRGLGHLFQSSLGTAMADPFDLGAGVTARLRAGAVPENQRLVNSTMDRLFSSGRLGTTGGANVAGRLQEALNQQDLGFEQAGLEFGRGLQSDATGRLMSAFGGTEALLGRRFGESLAGAGLRSQNAMSRFGMGTSLANTLLQNLVMGQNIGMSNLQGAVGLAQLPLAFQNAALAAEAQRSGSEFNQAAVLQGNAQLAKSPLLGAINAVGQFFEPIKFPGTGGGG